MTDMIKFRPHHFLCALGYEGKGYSPDFTANMSAIVIDRLREQMGDATVIMVTRGLDDICAPCPRKTGQSCTHQSTIDRLDSAHGAALSLAPGDRLTWGEAKARIRSAVEPGKLTTLCAGCEWLPLGLCEMALARLHSDQE